MIIYFSQHVFARFSSYQRKVKVKSLSRARLFETSWTVAYQALQSMGFFRQEYWSGLPFPSPGDLPNPGIESVSPALQTDTLPSKPPGGESNQASNQFPKCSPEPRTPGEIHRVK